MLREVVGDAVREARVVDGDVVAVAGEIELQEIPDAQDRRPGTDEEIAVELRAESAAADEADSAGRDGMFCICSRRPGSPTIA